MKRVYSDSQLASLKYAELASGFRSELGRWAEVRYGRMGRELLSKSDRRSLLREVAWGFRHLRHLDRSIELKLPEAAARMTHELDHILHGLIEHFDWVRDHNALAGPVNKIREARQKGQRVAVESKSKVREKRNRRIIELHARCIAKGWTGKRDIRSHIVQALQGSDLECNDTTVKKVLKAARQTIR